MARGRSDTQHDIGALEQRVYAIEQGLQSISVSINALSSKIDERSRTSWPTLASFATVIVVLMGALGTLALRPNSDAIERLYKKADAFENHIITQQGAVINRLQSKIDGLDLKR